MKDLLFFIAFLLAPALMSAQGVHKKSVWKTGKHLDLQPIILLQFWGAYTMDEELFDETTASYMPVANRLDFQLRRSRIGVKGRLTPQLKFNLTSAYDLVGRDLLSGTQGGANNGSSPSLRLWNAYVQWQLKEKSQAWNLTVGYFTPRIGRESTNSPFNSGSMEKAWSQNYLRRHLVGIGPGRAMGINMGGLLTGGNKSINWAYEVGLFTPNVTNLSGSSVGMQASPLVVARLLLYLGDMESAVYQLGYKANYQNKRKGLTVGLAAAAQGATDLFDASYTRSVEWLFNWDGLNIDGDYSLMQRKGHIERRALSFTSAAQTGYIRLSYNFPVKTYVLEPSLMFVHFQGGSNQEEVEQAALLNNFAGRDQSLELGINFHLNSAIRLNLHYTTYDGDAGAAEAGAVSNNYLFQQGVGAIHRGNWLGIGLIAKY